jgi:antitoxin (DNA-binding transcriptional repressor) of toxin-antitoxin stability system
MAIEMDKTDKMDKSTPISLSATQAKQSFGELMHLVTQGHVINITSHQRIKAVVSPPDATISVSTLTQAEDALQPRRLALEKQASIDAQRWAKHARWAIQLLTMSATKRRQCVRAAQVNVERWKRDKLCSDDYIAQWERLLRLPVKELAQAMVGDLQGWGRSLRQNTPFDEALFS